MSEQRSNTQNGSDELADFLCGLSSMGVPPPVKVEVQEKIDYWERKMAPLGDRLKILLAKMSPEELAAGMHVTELSKRMAGRFNGKAAPREIAAELRKLGYISRRRWEHRDAAGVKTLWFPPSNSI